jgi:hypothetical protein
MTSGPISSTSTVAARFGPPCASPTRTARSINHPGSTLVLSNATGIANTGINRTNAGRLVNLGTLRTLASANSDDPAIRLEDVRMRNDGRVEVATGKLKIAHLDNEGAVEMAAGTKLFLPARLRGGVSSRIIGDGDIEFGEYIAGRRPVVFPRTRRSVGTSISAET